MNKRASPNLAALGAAFLLAAACRQASAAGQGGTSGVSFLTMEQGARPVGMGGAYSAVADDVNALWWNPAGIAHSKFTELTVSHAQFIESVTTEFIGLTRPVEPLHGTVGASLTYLTIPGIDGFDASGNPTGQLAANGYAASFAYATLVQPQLSAGVSGKLIGQKFASQTGSGFAVDVGAQFRQGPFSVGFAAQNLGPAFKFAGTSNPLPQSFRGGVAYALLSNLTLALDEEKTRDSDLRTHVGAELRANQNFQLRTGYEQQDNVGAGAGFTVGFTLQGVIGGGQGGGWAGESTPWWEKDASKNASEAVKQGGYLLSLDYAFLSFGDFSDVHRITFNLKF